MTDFQRGIITLMKCAITGTPEPLPEGFSMDEAEAFAVKQSIDPLIYYGAAICGIPKNLPAMQRLFQRYIRHMLRSERQMAAAEKIFAVFEENGIHYLPLKGVNMKKLYPKPELRTMGDADILIKIGQYAQIQYVLTQLGFENGLENEYECHWNNGQLHLELHKSLFHPENKDFCSYWGNGWNLAECEDGSRYGYTPELTLMYLFIHFTKHYRKCGIGCNHVLDLWLFLRETPQIDMDYLFNELEKLHLKDFFCNILRLHQVWFENAAPDDVSDFITQFIFSGGRYGSVDSYALSMALRSGNSRIRNRKFALLLNKAFPALDAMRYHYPILNKLPVLLPVFWLVRIFNAVFFKRSMVRKAQRIIQIADDENVATYHRALQYVGLDFHFE